MTSKNVREYLEELEKTKGGRPEQVKDGIEIYVDLWKRAIDKGVVMETDLVGDALLKLEKRGGLYKAAED